MTNQTFEFIAETTGERLDKVVAVRFPDLSRTQVKAMITDGHVTVNGAQVKAGVKLHGGENIAVILPDVSEPELIAEDIPLNFVYEDEYIGVIDKPAGLVIHPGLGNETGTLVNALLARYPHLRETERKGIVHRLDKDTSGLIIIAKTDAAITNLMEQFQERTVDKNYIALTERSPRTAKGVIDAPIGRDTRQRKQMAVIRGGKPAQTEFEVVEENLQGDRALLRCKLLTGRTHQIRVHLAFINAPIVGDIIYGYRKQRLKLKRQFLHSTELSFNHPITGERMTLESPLPAGLQNILDKLRIGM